MATTGEEHGLVADFTVPVYNEEHVLRSSIERLHAYLSATFPYSWQISIADNASTDATRAVARTLATEFDHVRLVELDRKGRGLALRTAWETSTAEIVAYMDVDLSTGLDAILPLITAIKSGHSEVAIGSRLAPGALVARGPRREFISRSYNRILRTVFLNRFRDAQCGFKAIRREVAEALLPLVEDNAWFFDTELLLVAEHNGLRVFEVPVDWVDDPDSRVHVVSTATDDLKGVVRVARTFIAGRGKADLGRLARPGLADDMGRQLVSFAIVGTLSTAICAALFMLLRTVWHPIWSAAAAYSAVAAINGWANRRYTFGHRSRSDGRSHLLRLVILYLVGLGLTVGVAVLAHGPRWREVLALLGLWAVLAVVRLTALRAWVFRRRHQPDAGQRVRWRAGQPG